MTRRDEITTTDWSMRLDDMGRPGTGIGEVVTDLDDVHQAIRIIVSTPPGTDPLRPQFACDLFGYLDRPMTVAVPHIVRAVTLAILRWEPRVIVERVTVGQPKIGTFAVSVIWRLNIQQPSATRTTTISLPVRT